MDTMAIGWSTLSVLQQCTRRWCNLPPYTFKEGSHIAVIGACGTGKTALARALCGYGIPDCQKGDILLSGRPLKELAESEIAKRIAYVPPQANTVLSGIAQTLEGEMALTLQFLGTTKSDTEKSISKWTDFLGIQTLLLRDPMTLSGGELLLAALAITLVKNPRIVVLDTCHDFLHPDSRATLRHVTSELSRNGCVVIETFPRIPECPERFDHFILLTESEVAIAPYPEIRHIISKRCPELFISTTRSTSDCTVGKKPLDSWEPSVVKHTGHLHTSIDYKTLDSRVVSLEGIVLRVTNLLFWYDKDGFRFGPTSLEVCKGETVSIVGPNGSGKTTLMKLIACLLESKSGTVGIAIGGTNVWELPPKSRGRHNWAKFVLYGFQNPDDQLYLTTVREELASVAQNTAKPVSSSMIEDMAVKFGLSAYLDDSPVDLPGPMRRLITLAAAFLACPPVLLLDEPTAGLDIQQINGLTMALRSYTRSGGACLFVSHDSEFIAHTADRSIELLRGQRRGYGSIKPENHR